MLIVAGYFEVEPDRREEFIAARTDAMRRSRQETGCITYVFSADPIEVGLVHLFERWESKEALAAHLEVMRASGRPNDSQVVISSEVKQYEIAEVGTVGS